MSRYNNDIYFLKKEKEIKKCEIKLISLQITYLIETEAQESVGITEKPRLEKQIRHTIKQIKEVEKEIEYLKNKEN